MWLGSRLADVNPSAAAMITCGAGKHRALGHSQVAQSKHGIIQRDLCLLRPAAPPGVMTANGMRQIAVAATLDSRDLFCHPY